jgi:glucose/mannose transport system substrate-binding protein
MSINRNRGFAMAVVAVVMSLVLAACGGGGEEAASGESSEAGASGGPASTEFEFFSWWTGEGDSEGKQALLDLFAEQNPDVEIIDAAVAGGAGTNAQAVLTSRLQANDPPDSYQRHVGAELQPDIEAGLVEDLTWLYDEEGWRDVIPQEMLDLITVDDKIYSVPVNIHRSNLLWYNPAVLEEAGIDGPPATWDEFLQQAQTLEQAGKVALTIGPLWTQKHLLENVLLGELGPEAYMGLWDGTTDWESPEVVAALDMFTEVLGHSNIDQAAADWQPAIDPIIEGDAAYNVMGDWADTYFRVEQELTWEEEYNATTSPGTEGVFNFLSDSFTLPVDAPNRDVAIDWLRLAGSQEGQDTFNPVKGSIPARQDANPRLYNTYLKSALRDWKSNKLAGSLTHGVVASNAWNTAIDTALGQFLQSKNSSRFQTGLVAAARKYT